MASPSLPLEVIQSILSYLSEQDVNRLLIQPINREWFFVIASVAYRRLTFTQRKQVVDCLNLFRQTQQRQQQQGQARQSFYSAFDYTSFVRHIGFSPFMDITTLRQSMIVDLVKVCSQLTSLNLYNCFTVSTKGMATILLNCLQLRQLSLAGATSVSATCFLDKRVLSEKACCQHLQSLNINLQPIFFDNPHDFKISKDNAAMNVRMPAFPALETLKLGHIFRNDETKMQRGLFNMFLERCSQILYIELDSVGTHAIHYIFSQCNNIISITLRRCGLDDLYLDKLGNRLLTCLDLDTCGLVMKEHKGGYWRENEYWQSEMNELVTAASRIEYSQMERWAARKMEIPQTILNKALTACSGTYLTSIDCPDNMTDEDLTILMNRCPYISHFSAPLIRIKPTQGIPAQQRQQRQARTRRRNGSILSASLFGQALEKWSRTLTFLEFHGGRYGGQDGAKFPGTRYGLFNVTDEMGAPPLIVPRTNKEFSKDQETLIDILCQMRFYRVETLLLGDMIFKIPIVQIQQLAFSFPSVRYLSLKAKETEDTSDSLRQAVCQWPLIEGFYCVNHSDLMQHHNNSWNHWRWMEALDREFNQWKNKILVE